jgi:hypothetical protein
VADIEGGSGASKGTGGVEVPMFDHVKSTSKLTTSGLTNCIAVVAYHHGQDEATWDPPPGT